MDKFFSTSQSEASDTAAPSDGGTDQPATSEGDSWAAETIAGDPSDIQNAATVPPLAPVAESIATAEAGLCEPPLDTMQLEAMEQSLDEKYLAVGLSPAAAHLDDPLLSAWANPLVNLVASIDSGSLAESMQAEKPLTKETLFLHEQELAKQKTAIDGARTTTSPMATLCEFDKKRLADMEKMVEGAWLNPRTTLGNEFRAELKAGKIDQHHYGNLSRGDANDFRVKWLAEKLQEFKQRKVHAKKYSRVDRTKGTYKYLGTLIVDSGGYGDREAINGSLTLAQKCLAMGSPWVMRHPQSERLMYLELSFDFAEEFKESWAEFKEEHAGRSDLETLGGAVVGGSGSGSGDAANDGGAQRAAGQPAPADAAADVPAAKGKGKGKAKGKGKEKPTDPPPPTEKEIAQKKFNALVAEATKVKDRFHTTISNAMELLEAIQSDSAWAWALNEQNRGVLEQLVNDTRSSISVFGRQFLTETTTALKKRYSTEALTVEFRNFIEIDLSKLIAHIDTLRKRHTIG